jgi:2-polyprenyl-3-methyl-5-hydroxy-6-metoxy-1,4-benzoquinol methylase
MKNNDFQVAWEGHCGPRIDSVNDYDIIDCKSCGFKHIVPIPTDEEIESFYRTKFYGEHKNDYFRRQQQDLDWWNMVFDERYQLFENQLKKNQRRILDIGCGPGYFLKCGQETGWDVLGLEPSRLAAEYARSIGVKVINQSLTKRTAQDLGRFHVVYMNGVMEHLSNPLEFLRLCAELLEPDGLLFTCVANDYNPFQRILRDFSGFQPWWLVPPEHINYFSVPSGTRILEKSGFEIIHSTTTFPIDLFLLFGDNYVGNDSVGRECHRRRKNFELSMTGSGSAGLKREIYSALSKLNLGREIELLGRKIET